jgi:hypothetical protein
MTEQGIGAIVLEGGTTMSYFVNVRWGLSERPFLLVIPAKGDVAYVSPGFEEQRAREVIKFSNDVRVWQEDDDPLSLVGGILKDRGVSTAKIGVEERVRFFVANGLRRRRPRRRSCSPRPSPPAVGHQVPAELATMRCDGHHACGLRARRPRCARDDAGARRQHQRAVPRWGRMAPAVSFGGTAPPHRSSEPERGRRRRQTTTG